MRKVAIKTQLATVLSIIVVSSFSSVAFASRWRDLPDSLTAKYGITAGQVAAISDSLEGQWKPFQPITRAQFTKMAVVTFRILLTYRAMPSFTDVSEDSPYYLYIEGAKAAGILEDTTATTFSPNALITREEAIATIGRYVASKSNRDFATVSAELMAKLASVFDYGAVEDEPPESALANLWAIQPLSRIRAAALLIRSQAELPPPVGSSSTDLIESIGTKLVASIAGSAASQGFGWVLNLIDHGSIDGQTIVMLKQISGQLSQLQAQTASLRTQITYLAYDQLAGELTDTVSDINTAQSLLASLAASTTDPTATPEQIESLKMYIVNFIGDHIVGSKDAISIGILGTGLSAGLIEKWSQAVTIRHRFFNKADSDAQIAMNNYWLTLQAAQVELITEFYRAKNFPPNVANDLINQYTQNVQKEKEIIPRPLPFWINTSFPGRICVMQSSAGPQFDIMIDEEYFGSWGPLTYSIAYSNIGHDNGHAKLGFTNWRMPSLAEAHSMFDSAPIDETSFWSWWMGQGWEQRPEAVSSLFGTPLDYTLLGTDPYWPIRIDFSFWLQTSGDSYYRDMKGHTGDTTGLTPDAMYSLLLPVRSLNYSTGEFYFYHPPQ